MISFFLMKLTSAYYLLMIHHETFCETGTDFLDGKNRQIWLHWMSVHYNYQ